MVPSLPFVLINGKTDLPRIGNKKHHWRTYKKRLWENMSVHGYKQNKEYFKCKTQGFNQLFPRASHFKWMDTQI